MQASVLMTLCIPTPQTAQQPPQKKKETSSQSPRRLCQVDMDAIPHGRRAPPPLFPSLRLVSAHVPSPAPHDYPGSLLRWCKKKIIVVMLPAMYRVCAGPCQRRNKTIHFILFSPPSLPALRSSMHLQTSSVSRHM